MNKLIIALLLLSSCAMEPAATCRRDCDDVIKAEDARYDVCQSHVDQCMDALKATDPPLLTKAVYGVVGLALGLILGTRIK